MKAVALIALLATSSALAQEPTPRPIDTRSWSHEYASGWCAGYIQAQKNSMLNRDHFRTMMKFPAETFDESMTRLSAKWPPVPPEGFDIDGPFAEMLNLQMAAIDLYVVLPPVGLGWGAITFEIDGGTVFTCAEEKQ